MSRRVLALIAIIALVIVAACGIKWSAIELPHGNDAAVASSQTVEKTDGSEATEATAAEGTGTAKKESDTAWYRFYNAECLTDEDTTNDFDFGPRPDIENMSTQELYELWREVLWNDPAIGAGNLAWFDRLFGTRYLGEFYETCQGDWAKTINLAKERFMADETLYHDTLKAFFEYLESAVISVQTEKRTGLKDQMYVNPFTVSGVPDIVVFETAQNSGTFLRMNLKIKGSTVGGNPAAGNGGNNNRTLAFMVRADCLFQPTDVAELLNITPQENPTKKTPTTTTPTAPTPTTPTPTTPSKTTPVTPVKPVQPVTPVKPVQPVTPVKPVEPVTPSYNKDKSKGTQGDLVKPNDNPGPGPNTNNGVGATKSTKDTPTNTNNGQSYSDYKDDQKELATNPGKPALADNTPTYNPSKGNNGGSSSSSSKPAVDNNGSSGNSATNSAPINNPTPTTKPETTGGQTIKNDSSSNAAPEWGGTGD
jgi:hypothetical protein